MHTPTLISSLALTAGLSNAFSWQQPLGHPLFGSYFGRPGINATYDYVVVGGGLAGLTVATRLAENRSISVAVVEAGTFYEIANGNHSQIPYYAAETEVSDPDEPTNKWVDWDLITEPQPQLNDRRIRYWQGKSLGGSSSANQMIYQRGTRGSYDLWAQQVDDQSYSWDSMLPHFRRSMHFTPPDMAIRGGGNHTAQYDLSAWSLTGGPLQVSYPNFVMPFSPYGISALEAVGFEGGQTFESGRLIGTGYMPFTFDGERKTRASSEATFLAHAITANLDLTVYPMTQAMRIMFDDNKAATGVQVQSSGMTWTLEAKKEVISSAGVYHSPQLLMVSGVGPAKTLEAHDITVVHDSPGVGQNMHDCCAVGGVTHNVTLPTLSSIVENVGGLTEATAQFLQNATGVLGSIGGGVYSFEKLPAAYRSSLSKATLEKLAQWPADWPELEVSPSTGGDPAAPTDESASIGMILVAAISRGNMTIQSNSMLDKPIINTNWLLDPADQEVAVQAYRRAREIWKYVDQSIISSAEISPGANVTTDAELLEYIKSEGVEAIHHGSATCMMGTANETMAVVDTHAKVFGVKNLRVIDVSSLRFTPPGHTQAATYAHAEKLVDDIKRGL